MLYKIFNYVVFVILIHIFAIRTIYAQEYIFIGDPATILEHGTYKQSFNTGMYFYHKRQWTLAIDIFNRCSELTRKKVKHYKPLTWTYIYSGEYSLAIKSLSNINPRINAINIGTDIAIKVIPIIRPITSLRKLNPHYFFKGRYFF